MTLIYPFEGAPAPGEARAINAGVSWLRMPLPMAGLNHINLWALADGAGWTLVDTGMQTARDRDGLAERAQPGCSGAAGAARDLHAHAPGPHRHGRLADARSTSAGCGRRGWSTSPAACWWPTPVARRRRTACASTAPPAGTRRRSSTTGRASAASARRCYALPDSYRRVIDGEELEIGGQRWRAVVGRGHSPEHLCLYCPELKRADLRRPGAAAHHLERVGVPDRAGCEPAQRVARIARRHRRARPGRRAGAALAQRAVPRPARAPRRAHRRPRAAPGTRARGARTPRRAVDVFAVLFRRPVGWQHAQHGHRREHRAPELPDRPGPGHARELDRAASVWYSSR